MASWHEFDTRRLLQSIPRELAERRRQQEIVRSYLMGHADKHSSIAQLNYIPIGAQAISLVSPLIFSWVSDRTGKRLRPLLVHSVSRF